MRLRRGSISVLALIMLSATLLFVLMMLDLSGAVRQKQTRREDAKIVEHAFDGAVDYVVSYAKANKISWPTTFSLPVGQVQQSVRVTDGPLLSGTIEIRSTLTYKGKTYRHVRTVGNQKILGIL
ncbi:MAG TPA: hypothetical protein VM328_09010 [Fimbriimonadaceae bacterium]|nr:hypothetical protein [Fimbriimonadaceae bacterium]